MHIVIVNDKKEEADGVIAVLSSYLSEKNIAYTLEYFNEEKRFLSFIHEKTEYSLAFDNITVIKSEGHYLEINTLSGESFKTRMTFSEVKERLLEDKRFLPVLRGIIVNMDHIRNIKDGTCDLENGITIPVNIKKCKKLEQVWHSYIFGKKNNPCFP